MTERKTELEMRRAANILRAYWREGEPAATEQEAKARTAAGCTMSALLWAAGDDNEHAASFEAMVDMAREDLQARAAQN